MVYVLQAAGGKDSGKWPKRRRGGGRELSGMGSREEVGWIHGSNLIGMSNNRITYGSLEGNRNYIFSIFGFLITQFHSSFHFQEECLISHVIYLQVGLPCNILECDRKSCLYLWETNLFLPLVFLDYAA